MYVFSLVYESTFSLPAKGLLLCGSIRVSRPRYQAALKRLSPEQRAYLQKLLGSGCQGVLGGSPEKSSKKRQSNLVGDPSAIYITVAI